ncbi:MAG TPA: DciA family protein [Hyphomicrobiaceae bacterium]|nr:DciA family protein [Hyphomicrobiaceae bacterium]
MRQVAAKAAGPRAVGSYVPRLTRPSFEKFGFSAATLITDWCAIVGPTLAGYTTPDRLRWPRLPAKIAGSDDEATGRPGATLFIAVDPARALDVEYQRAQIIDRVNRYFGYSAIAEVRIEQRYAKTSPPQRAAPVRPQKPIDILPLSTVADDGLRAALQRLAEGLTNRLIVKT